MGRESFHVVIVYLNRGPLNVRKEQVEGWQPSGEEKGVDLGRCGTVCVNG